MIAQCQRIKWSGLNEKDFAYITSYENSRYCKPNPSYYKELAQKINVLPNECLMVGNDTLEDMYAAKQAGMHVFLLTDCLINKQRYDISQYPRGSYSQLLSYISNLK